MYVSLVNSIANADNWETIKSRFSEFRQNDRIKCYSIPINFEDGSNSSETTINNWWRSVEQKSIELALDYEYILHTDITDCYGSIYTHSISWALHGKETAKDNIGKMSFIGNRIDKYIQFMSYGQTNGIPQGSTLMDFIAEMVLGYSDLLLSEKIKIENIEDYNIIRYRDDYRIFTNNPEDAKIILKLLSEVLIELGMKLNASKTKESSNIITSSIKADKLFWKKSKNSSKNLQNYLLLIHNLAEEYPNSGSLIKALNKFYEKIHEFEFINENTIVLISILVDVMYKNPKTYPLSVAILSKILDLSDDIEDKNTIILKILEKFKKLPNTGILEVWLQRLSLKIDNSIEFKELLCKKIDNNTLSIWNSDWLISEMKEYITTISIIDDDIIDRMDFVLSPDEVLLFGNKDYNDY